MMFLAWLLPKTGETNQNQKMKTNSKHTLYFCCALLIFISACSKTPEPVIEISEVGQWVLNNIETTRSTLHPDGTTSGSNHNYTEGESSVNGVLNLNMDNTGMIELSCPCLFPNMLDLEFNWVRGADTRLEIEPIGHSRHPKSWSILAITESTLQVAWSMEEQYTVDSGERAGDYIITIRHVVSFDR